jgi:predicted nucleotidyltransferase
VAFGGIGDSSIQPLRDAGAAVTARGEKAVTEALNQDFVDMLQVLNDSGVEYLVVGAYAMAVHGVPRATGDIDLFIKPSPTNAQRVVAALQAFGAPVAAHGVRVEDLAAAGIVYQIGLPPRRIDLLTAIDGVSFDQAMAGSLKVDISGVPVVVIGKTELILNKRQTGRDKDKVDADLLER